MSKLLSLLKFIILILGCFGLTFLIVWPLWIFATKCPSVYTISILILLAIFFVVAIIRGIRNHVKK